MLSHLAQSRVFKWSRFLPKQCLVILSYSILLPPRENLREKEIGEGMKKKEIEKNKATSIFYLNAQRPSGGNDFLQKRLP